MYHDPLPLLPRLFDALDVGKTAGLKGLSEKSCRQDFSRKKLPVLSQLSQHWPARRQDRIFFRGARSKETRQEVFFAEPASLETRQEVFFAAQGPAIEDSLRIPSGVEAIPVKSGQQETRQEVFLGPHEKNFLSCLDRGGVRLPGDKTGFFFAGSPNFLQTRQDFSPAK